MVCYINNVVNVKNDMLQMFLILQEMIGTHLAILHYVENARVKWTKNITLK